MSERNFCSEACANQYLWAKAGLRLEMCEVVWDAQVRNDTVPSSDGAAGLPEPRRIKTTGDGSKFLFSSSLTERDMDSAGHEASAGSGSLGGS